LRNMGFHLMTLRRPARPLSPTDLTDPEWAIIAPRLPPRRPTGRKPAWPMRDVIDAIVFVKFNDIAWRGLPEGFPPPHTAFRWHQRFVEVGAWPWIERYLRHSRSQRRRKPMVS
jgi:putative transposase